MFELVTFPSLFLEHIAIIHYAFPLSLPLGLVLQQLIFHPYVLMLVAPSSLESSTIHSLLDFSGRAHGNNTS